MEEMLKKEHLKEMLVRATFGRNAYILDYSRPDGIDRRFVDDDGRFFGSGGMHSVTSQFESASQDPRHLGLGFKGLEHALRSRDEVRYEVSRSRDLIVVKSIRGRDRIEITIDPDKQFSVTELARISGDSKEAHQRTILQLRKFDGYWFPHKIMTFREGVKTEETTVHSAEFNRPEHKRRLTFSDVGLVSGDEIQGLVSENQTLGTIKGQEITATKDLRARMGGRIRLVWDAENQRTLNPIQLAQAKRDGTFKIDPRLQAIRNRGMITNTDPYTRYTMKFASDFHLSKSQLTSALGIAKDVRRQSPATQPSDVSAVLENSLRPRLMSLLTEEQQRSKAPAPARRP